MKKRTEILMIFSYYGIGGAQRRAINLANELVKNNYKVTILALLGEDGTIKDCDYYNINNQIRLISIPRYYDEHKSEKKVIKIEKRSQKAIVALKRIQYLLRFSDKLCERINYCIRGIRNSVQLRSYLVSHQGATIIHFGFNIFERTYFAAKGLDYKLVYAETNAAQKYKSERNYRYTKKLIHKIDACVCQTKEEILDHGLEESNKSFIIHNPISCSLPDVYVGERKKIIVNFCRLTRQKNLMLLIKAFEEFYKSHQDYQLHIYADSVNDYEYRNEIETYIKKQCLSNSIKLLPACADVHYRVCDASMFVSSSDYEGLSNSMIEAMAMGLPCVCTDCGGGGAREMIINEVNGILVPINDSLALANGMIKMADDSKLSQKCSQNAQRIRDDLNIEYIAKKWIDLLESIDN